MQTNPTTTTTTHTIDDAAAIDTAMASQDERDKVKGRIPTGGYLFTPPENVVDSFSHQDGVSEKDGAVVGWRPAVLPPLVHTPPASPEFSSLPSIAAATGYPAHDSPLFPDQTQSDRSRAQAELPLFEKARSPSPTPTEVTVSIEPRQEDVTTTTTPSRKGTFPFTLDIKTGQDALRYYYARMDELRAARTRLPEPRKSPAFNLDKESSRQLQSLTRSAGVAKSRPAPKSAPKPKALVATSPIKTSPPKRRTPKVRTYSDFVDSAFPQKESSAKHKRAPPSKIVEGENVEWTELPDYAPPSSDLDTNPRSLKVSWHGHALPLHDDPDTLHLHEQEVQVASTLRLRSNVYLTNKRKIFQARLQALKDGKNFTKTAAQSACKIDVNKASQLWEAFEKVGWFEERWFKRYL